MTSPPGAWRRRAELGLGVAASTVLFWLYSRVELPWMLLGWVGLVPWLLGMERAVRSWGSALGAGLAFSAGFTLTIFGWFAGALRGYSGAPAWVCWLVLLGLSPLLQPQFITFALARYAARRAPGVEAGGQAFWRAALAGACVYVGTEWLAPKLFADTLGYGLHASEYLRQGADVAGAAGLTLVLVLANECALAAGLAWAARRGGGLRRAWRPAGAFAALVLVCVGYGALRLRMLSARAAIGQGYRVGVVQANITSYERLAAERGRYEAVRTILDTHYALSDALLEGRGRAPDFLIWPETVYPTTFGSPKSEDGAELDAEIEDFVAQRQVSLIFGAYDWEEGQEFNAAMFLGPPRAGRRQLTAYRKTLLFPLTEWVPGWLDSQWLRQRLPWLGTWQRGPGPRAVHLPLAGGGSVPLVPLICYEAIYTGYAAQAVRQGAQMLVTLSNDSWFSGTPAPRLHLLLAAFRSIETRRPQVRVTNSGISAFISPSGDILSEIPDAQRASRIINVPQPPGVRTLVVAWGDWLGPTALVLGAALLAWGRRGAARA